MEISLVTHIANRDNGNSYRSTNGFCVDHDSISIINDTLIKVCRIEGELTEYIVDDQRYKVAIPINIAIGDRVIIGINNKVGVSWIYRNGQT